MMMIERNDDWNIPLFERNEIFFRYENILCSNSIETDKKCVDNFGKVLKVEVAN